MKNEDIINIMGTMLGINSLIWILIAMNGLSTPLIYAIGFLNILIPSICILLKNHEGIV